MKISTKGEYGIRAMMELAQHCGEGYVPSAKIAKARKIPENYLHQLLITLRKAGLVRSRRGPQGGHMLSRSPEQINLAEVVTALEGPIEPVDCIQANSVADCPFFERCVVRSVWERISQATERILQETDFAQLAKEERRMWASLAEAS